MTPPRELYHVAVSNLRAHHWPEQMRPGRVAELVQFYRKHGRPPTPIYVTIDDHGVLWIGNGRHRWEAAKQVGRRTIPAYVACAESAVALLRAMRRARDRSADA